MTTVTQTLALNPVKKHSVRYDAKDSDVLPAFASLYLSKTVLVKQQIPDEITVTVDLQDE